MPPNIIQFFCTPKKKCCSVPKTTLVVGECLGCWNTPNVPTNPKPLIHCCCVRWLVCGHLFKTHLHQHRPHLCLYLQQSLKNPITITLKISSGKIVSWFEDVTCVKGTVTFVANLVLMILLGHMLKLIKIFYTNFISWRPPACPWESPALFKGCKWPPTLGTPLALVRFKGLKVVLLQVPWRSKKKSSLPVIHPQKLTCPLILGTIQ